MIEPLTAQVASGQYAASELREADRMTALIQHWDLLRYSEKLYESAKGRHSRFRDVPGFQPTWCGVCQSEVLLDYTEDPEGACMECGALSDAVMPAAA